MNAGEVAKLGWQFAGEDSRFDGDDLTTTNGALLLDKLNAAYATIATHKFPRIGIIPFRGLEQSGTFTAKYVATTVASVTDAGEFVVNTTNVSVGDLLTVDGENVEVLSASSSAVTVEPDLGSTPSAGDAVVVRTKKYSLTDDVGAPARRVVEVQDVYDLTNRHEVFRVNNVDFFDTDGRYPAPPESYVRYGTETLLFNNPPDEAYNYRVRWIQLPSELTSASDELVLPEHFHEAIAMRLAFILLLIREDYDAAWKMKQNYQEELQRLQNEYEPFWDTNVGRIVLE